MQAGCQKLPQNYKLHWKKIKKWSIACTTHRTEIRVLSYVAADVGVNSWQGHEQQKSISGTLTNRALTVDVWNEQGKDEKLGRAVVCLRAKEALQDHRLLGDAGADLMQNQNHPELQLLRAGARQLRLHAGHEEAQQGTYHLAVNEQELFALRDEEFVHAKLFHAELVLVVALAAAPIAECLQNLRRQGTKRELKITENTKGRWCYHFEHMQASSHKRIYT